MKDRGLVLPNELIGWKLIIKNGVYISKERSGEVLQVAYVCTHKPLDLVSLLNYLKETASKTESKPQILLPDGSIVSSSGSLLEKILTNLDKRLLSGIISGEEKLLSYVLPSTNDYPTQQPYSLYLHIRLGFLPNNILEEHKNELVRNAWQIALLMNMLKKQTQQLGEQLRVSLGLVYDADISDDPLQLSYRFNESLNLSKEMRLLTKHLVSDSAILQVRPKSYHPGLLKVALDLAIEILLKNNLAKNLKKEEEFPKIEERTDEVYFEILAPRIYPLIQGQKSANQHYQE